MFQYKSFPPFAFSPIAFAIQGLVPPDELPSTEHPRAAIVGRGPGTTVNLSAYLASLKRRQVLPTVHTPAHTARKRAARRRQRREEEVLQLLCDF